MLVDIKLYWNFGTSDHHIASTFWRVILMDFSKKPSSSIPGDYLSTKIENMIIKIVWIWTLVIQTATSYVIILMLRHYCKIFDLSFICYVLMSHIVGTYLNRLISCANLKHCLNHEFCWSQNCSVTQRLLLYTSVRSLQYEYLWWVVVILSVYSIHYCYMTCGWWRTEPL